MNTQVVLLNGVGSSGKSTIARELQGIASIPMLHVAMDSFLEMLPAGTFDTPEGITFAQHNVDGYPVVSIHSGATSERALAGMRRAVSAMAFVGNHLIVDEVATQREIAEYRELLIDCDVTVVKIDVPLEVLEQRERERGDRLIGLARGQHSSLHDGIEYDLVVDAARLSSAQCAEFIRTALGL